MLSSSWNELDKEIVSNCFRHCGFFRAKFREEPFEPEILFEIENELKSLEIDFNYIHPNFSFNDFLSVDNELQISEPLEEIVPLPLDIANDGEIEEINDIIDLSDNEVEEERSYERFEVLEFIQKIKKYGLNSKNEKVKLEILSSCNNLESSIFEAVNLNQKKITDYFS